MSGYLASSSPTRGALNPSARTRSISFDVLGAPRKQRLLKFLLWLVISCIAGLAINVGFAAFAGWLWLRGSLPQTTGTVRVAGLSAPVTIVRDSYGVPTIHASTAGDAFFGLGYAHAQDRFFQLELQRLTGQGRLSEFAGAATVETDTYMRKLGLYQRAEDEYKTLRPEARQTVDAYTAGVNAWLSSHADALPPELGLLHLAGVKLDIVPWRPADTLVWPKILAFLLSGNFSEELLRADIIDKLGAERAEQLFDHYPVNGPVTVASTGATPRTEQSTASANAPTRAATTTNSARDSVLRLLAEYHAASLGSNAWVIGPSRTTTGHPLLSNDTHLPVQSPAIYYTARLEAPGLHVVGVTLPGVPFVIAGRNDRIAWGVTNLGPDTQDLFLERVDPADPTHYLTPNGSVAFTVRREEIRVNGKAEPIVLSVRETRHGPIIHDDWNGRGPLALRWPALDANDTSLEAFLDIDRATSWDQFRAGAAKLVSPALNFIYADVDGHIGYSASGRIPIRKQGQGLVPGNGWDDAWEWTGYVAFDQLPSTFDPADGFIVSANNKVATSDEPFLSTSWAYERAARIREMILATPKHSFDDLRVMRSDRKSSLADELLPALLTAKPTDPRDAEALARVAAWDRVESVDSVGGAIFTAWYAHLLSHLVRDELGPDLYDRYAGDRTEVMSRLMADPTGQFCDDQTTPARETCAEIARLALHDAVEDLTQRLGTDSNNWRLDRLRKTRFADPVGSMAPLIGGMFTREVQTGGDPVTVWANAFAYQAPYATILCPADITEYDMAPNGATRIALTMGQSEHPLSPHFADYLPHWLRSEGVPAPEASSSGDELRLIPREAR
jgi:penicillin amidase